MITFIFNYITNNIIKLFVFLNIIILVTYPSSSKVHPFYSYGKQPILYYEQNKKEMLIKGRKFLDKCLQHPNKLK